MTTLIVLKSHETPIFRDEALGVGADAVVLKRRVPFDLIPAIQGALRARQMLTPRQE